MKYRKILDNLTPYKPGKSPEDIKREYNLTHVHKLASNENPYGCSSKVLEALKNSPSFELYPDNSCSILKKALSEKLNISEDMIMPGAGSSEILRMLCQVLIEKDDEIITCMPSFGLYISESILQNGKVITLPLTSEYKFDLDAILASVTNNTKLVFIANPNNPTGTILTFSEIEAFLKKLPKNIIVALDEAYCEFVQNRKFGNSLSLLPKHKNLCVLRTFSKIYGLAGLRVGYACATSKIITQMDKVRSPFDVSSISQIAATAAISDDNFLKICHEKNEDVLDFLYQELDYANISYIKSEANFIMIDTKMDANDAFTKLLTKGFIVRPGFSGMDTYIRVTIGTMSQMEEFVKALKEIL